MSTAFTLTVHKVITVSVIDFKTEFRYNNYKYELEGDAKYTEEYKEAAAKDRQRAERSVTRVEEELREEVQRRFDENYKEQIQATERAKRNRDKTDTILKIKTIFSSMGIGLSHIHMIPPLPVGMEALSKSSYFLTS